MWKKLKMRFFRFFHFSSLDVVFGAVAMQAMLWQVLVGGFQAWTEHIVLGVSVWIFYLADRQVDNLLAKPTDAIHFFHQRFHLLIRRFILFLLLILGSLLSYISEELRYLGIYLSVCMGLYGLTTRYWDRVWLPKELFTSILYACGLFLPSLAVGEFSWLLFIDVFSLAFMNLSLFTWLEGKADFRFVFYWLQWILVGLLGYIAWQFSWQLALCLAIIQGIHVGIYYFSPNLQYRWVGELAFLSPLVYFVYELF
jgi:hypothetical protein